MLMDVLQLTAERGSSHCEDIAQRLGASQKIVLLALDELARRGYIAPVVPGCARPCEGCPFKFACLLRAAPRIWTLTPKGEAAVARRPARRESSIS